MHGVHLADHSRGRQKVFKRGVGGQHLHCWIAASRHEVHVRQLEQSARIHRMNKADELPAGAAHDLLGRPWWPGAELLAMGSQRRVKSREQRKRRNQAGEDQEACCRLLDAKVNATRIFGDSGVTGLSRVDTWFARHECLASPDPLAKEERVQSLIAFQNPCCFSCDHHQAYMVHHRTAPRPSCSS